MDVFEQYAALPLRPVKVTPHFKRLVDEEIAAIGPGGPLWRVAYPTQGLIHKRHGDCLDTVGDFEHTKAPGIVQKYADRVLFLAHDQCFGNCMYCYRQAALGDLGSASFEERLAILEQHLASVSSVREIIFSGGEPLLVRLNKLQVAFHSLSDRYWLRLHTHALVYQPNVITVRLAGILARYKVRVVTHVIHPYEIGSEFAVAVRWLRRAGVQMYAQIPVLRGINDHSEVLRRLLIRLDELGIRPLTLIICDPVSYLADFRFPLRRLLSIVNDLRWHNPSWVSALRVVLDTPIGKVLPENIVEWDGLNVTFEREGRRWVYEDIPFDETTQLSRLLWGDYQ